VSTLELERLRIELVEGEPEGACGAQLAGCGPLPEAVTALGVTN
jgi:hypothetical protein